MKRRDGRPRGVSRAEWRLAVAASKKPIPRRRKKSAPSSIPAGGFRRVNGEGFFARVVPAVAPSPLGAVPQVDWDAADEMARNDVFAELLRLDVDPSLAAELARIDPNAWYVVIATVRGGSGSYGVTGGERKGHEITNRVVLVGRGSRLWGRFLHLCDPDGGGSVLVDVEVHEMAIGQNVEEEIFPLWSGQRVTTLAGVGIEGAGEHVLWKLAHDAEVEPRKRGPRRKSGGGMNADERRAEKKRQRERTRRAEKTKARRFALEDSNNPVAAARLRKKRDASVKAHTRKPKPGKGRTR